MTISEDLRAAFWLPVGAEGSARARYGAAMGLHAAGELSAGALEYLRRYSARDQDDPFEALADTARFGPLPPRPRAPLPRLLGEIARLLASLDGPGIAEARHGLAAAHGTVGADPAPREGGTGANPPQQVNPVMQGLLPAALAAMEDKALAAAIAAAAPLLTWITYEAYDPALIGPAFPAGHAYAALVGPDRAMLPAEDFDLGLFLMAPRLLYRDHRHAAPELYLPLTGPHFWRFSPGAPFAPLPALAPVWNRPFAPHATLTGDQSFLCLYAWTADVMSPAEVVPALDWARYETEPP